ncbi:MAG TPA: CHRD domain-containing protein [Candidatus Binatia bacterium]|nr:CHRD domain-containing protein [Candidatus Binatia bacterium]
MSKPRFQASRTAVTIAVSAVLMVATGARGTIIQFEADPIDGAHETPPNASVAMASGTMTMDTDANTLSYNIVISVLPPSGETAAHIHGFSAPGVPSGILHPLPPGSPKVGVWNFLEAQQANIIAGLTYVNIHSNDFPLGEIRGQIERVPSCGDGFVDAGEDCDDGNNDNGDCCDATCGFEAQGDPCEGTSLCSEEGECDGEGECVAAPRGGCRTALKSILLLKDDPSDDTKDKLVWKWIKGDATDQDDFGVPTGTTNYALCIYTGTVNSLIYDPEVPGDSVLWKPISDKGYKYKDPTGDEDGVTKVLLKGGAQGKAKTLMKGKGVGLPDPTLGNLPFPVTAQLVNSANNICFQGQYDAPDEILNTSEKFKAKAQ